MKSISSSALLLTLFLQSSQAQAEPDVIELAGQYLAAVAFYENLSKSECRSGNNLWKRDYAKSEQWLVRLVDQKDRSEFISILPDVRKLVRTEGVKFEKTKIEIMAKAATKDLGCAYLFGLVTGLASRPELALLVVEQKKYRRITPADER